MSLLEWLGLRPASGEPERGGAAPGSPPAMAAVEARLTSLPAERARHVAALAVVLARAARADLDVSREETSRMEQLVESVVGLDLELARLVTEVAVSGALGGADEYLAARELRRSAPSDERLRILDALFAVAAADDSVSLAEEEEIRSVAREMGLTHEEYVAARSKVRDQREVLRGLDRG